MRMKQHMKAILTGAVSALIGSTFFPYIWSRWSTFAILLGLLVCLLVLGIQNWKETRGKAQIGVVCLGAVLAFFMGDQLYKQYEAVASIEQSFSEKRGMSRKEYGRSRWDDIEKMAEDCYKKCEPCARKCDEEYQRKVEETRHMSKDGHDPKSDCGYLRELAWGDREVCKRDCSAGCYAAHVKRIREISWWMYYSDSSALSLK